MKDKVRGAIVGVAIGDALGMPVEGLLPETIEKCYGGIKSYRTPSRKCRSHHTLKRGQYTDDTQLTLAIGESIVANRGINYNDIASKHVQSFQGERRGWGKATTNGCQRILIGIDWWNSGETGAAGNGPPMKIAPIGVLYGLNIINKFDLITSCINISRMTHGDPKAATAAICQAYLVGVAIQSDLDIFTWELGDIPAFAEEIENVICEENSFSISVGNAIDMVNCDGEEIRKEIGAKSFVNESVAFTYGMLYKYVDNLQECMEKIINQGGDADTTGALAGSILGAVYGYSKFPEKWRRGLEDRARLIRLADDLYSLSKEKD